MTVAARSSGAPCMLVFDQPEFILKFKPPAGWLFCREKFVFKLAIMSGRRYCLLATVYNSAVVDQYGNNALHVPTPVTCSGNV